MKELKPITRTRFKCDFCNKVYVKAVNCAEHETVCYRNPNRTCNKCHEEGVELFPAFGGSVEYGIVFDAREEDCSACKIAAEVGGKSYLLPTVSSK